MRRSIALLILFFCFAVPLHAQRRSEGVAPPPVVTQSITVRPGETVVVPLGIHGARGEQLEFLIRSQPRSGKLSPVRAVGANSAQVAYTAPVKGAEEDRFTYAVRSRDGVSAPGVVSISIPAIPVLPAKLSAPETIDLPKVFPGQRATADLELRNTGGTALEGEAGVPTPWSFEGQKRYSIGPGERVVLKVAFVAEKPGTFTADVALGPEQRRNVALKCEVEEALVVSPARLSLPSVPGDKARKAVLQISNRSEEDLAVTVTAGARLIADKKLTVPAKGKVDVSIAAAVPSAFDEQVILQSKGWRAEIPVHADALQIAAEPAPAPPPVPVVENSPPPVVPVANVAASLAPEAPVSPAKEVHQSSPLQTLGKVADFPNLVGKFARATSATSAWIEWPTDIAPAAGLHFQIRELSVSEADQLNVTWRDLPKVGIKESGGRLSAEIQGLMPAQLHTLRAVRGAETVFTVQFSTPAKKPFINVEWRVVFIILLIPVLAWLAWRKWKTRARSAW